MYLLILSLCRVKKIYLKLLQATIDVVVGGSDIDVEKVRPVLGKVGKAVGKCDILMDQCSVKCKFCEFLAKDKNGHIKARDPTKAN